MSEKEQNTAEMAASDNQTECFSELINEDETDFTEETAEATNTAGQTDACPEKKFLADASDEENADDGNDFSANASDEMAEKSLKRQLEKRRICIDKKFLTIAGIVFGILVIIYFSGVIYYNSHFYFGTLINSNGCSNMTIAKAKEKIDSNLANYKFLLKENGDVTEAIYGKDIDLGYASMGNIEEIKALQNPFLWCFDFKNRRLELPFSVSMNETLFYEAMANLKCVAKSNEQMEGATAYIAFNSDSCTYSLTQETGTDIISYNTLCDAAKRGICGLYADMDLQAEGCYVSMSGEDRIAALLAELNKMISTKVTYTNGDTIYSLDSETINAWLNTGEDYIVNINSEAVREWVNALALKYDTIGTTRTFVSSGGESVQVSGGDYGWNVDVSKETDALCGIIQNGEQTTREPEYRQTAASHGNVDFGNTYVEINLSAQHLWFYKDGSVIVSTDFVSGDPTHGNQTSTGVYSLKYKERNATLKGEDYATPVSFWMPFNDSQGMHDATWRSSFGGSIYMGSGSHGCVNLPYSAAASIYENISSGDPVIVY